MHPETKLKTWAEIEDISRSLHEMKKKIIFTNGCFDILHAGHVAYLNDAKQLGDVMIVGLNSDDSIHRIKGESRPVNLQRERAFVLGGLADVDYIVIFNEDTPYDLIKLISPNVLVKGGDWLPENIVGNDIVTANGGEVKSLPYREGFSTTDTITKIIESYRHVIEGEGK
ncbi:MAG TPA: D-glycero-beta-D-manno-heptose 1-phosphate adenylyltransferase [Candidatus Cloacimonadota bacterium]|nr:D-glycero-beta-D-manno-heptose 1-phosphate adenylyltransferase [Candidatus Cloacimonadota bacterium]HPT71521.1 D-glycero-beta-D-manno-heptose 1-phosphate adenylyltransferase [Candidatus Cloacimonadota bacterium]